MNIFKIIKEYVLKRESCDEVFQVISDSEVLKEAVKLEEEVVFESNDLTEITESSFIDTTSPLSIAKYKNNLRLLVAEAKSRGKIDQFRLIRDDDFFPYNWEWCVGSKDTALELDRNPIGYAMRKALAYQKMGLDIKNSFMIPSMDNKFKEELGKIDINLGAILSPVKFRSTKHFTVNTPLSYTGEYNFVESNRKFTVIDNIGNFLNSGYAYTADYRDSYLDVTHESLKISDQAIVLISEDKYQSIINDPIIFKQLKDRKVIVYRGDEAVAINMVLSECGVLPARPGNKYMIYDDETRNILDNSMKELCVRHNIQYAKGHGNLFGKGGHFSDLYDGYNHDYEKSKEQFLTFLLQAFPQAEGLLSHRAFSSVEAAEELVQVIGVEPLLQVISKYNDIVRAQFDANYKKYMEDRSSITPEISNIFKQTVKFIDTFYLNEQDATLSMDDLYRFKELVRLFFHSNTVDAQLLAATEINQMFGLNFEDNMNKSSDFSI